MRSGVFQQTKCVHLRRPPHFRFRFAGVPLQPKNVALSAPLPHRYKLRPESGKPRRLKHVSTPRFGNGSKGSVQARQRHFFYLRWNLTSTWVLVRTVVLKPACRFHVRRDSRGCHSATVLPLLLHPQMGRLVMLVIHPTSSDPPSQSGQDKKGAWPWETASTPPLRPKGVGLNHVWATPAFER